MYASESMADPHRNGLPVYMCSQLKKQKKTKTKKRKETRMVHTCLSKKVRRCIFNLLLHGAYSVANSRKTLKCTGCVGTTIRVGEFEAPKLVPRIEGLACVNENLEIFVSSCVTPIAHQRRAHLWMSLKGFFGRPCFSGTDWWLGQ